MPMGAERRELVGSVLDGRYAIDGVLAEGTSSTVFDARDIRTKHRFAIKVWESATEARIQRETRAALVLHPNVCGIVDVCAGVEVTYVVMERLTGETLAQRIAKRGALGATDVIDIFVQLTSALTAVHDAGLIHADVKPANVFLVARHGGRAFVKLLDFGASLVAKDAGTPEGWSGTPAYMAPEQARRDPKIDVRADIYSAGVTLFEALAGKRPFGPRDYRFLIAPREDALPEISSLRRDVPPVLARVVARATAADRDDRFATAREMQAALFTRARQSEPPRASQVRPRVTPSQIKLEAAVPKPQDARRSKR